MGLSIATELVARGFRPRIIDPAGKPGAHACSWRAGGMLAPWCEAESAEPVVLRLGQDAADWWQGNGAEVTRRGTLVLAPARLATSTPEPTGCSANAGLVEAMITWRVLFTGGAASSTPSGESSLTLTLAGVASTRRSACRSSPLLPEAR